MSQIFNDNVQIDMTIDGDPWLVSEAEVERSRISTPDYVDIEGMIPHPEETEPELGDFEDLIGAPFRLSADNNLISDRDTDANEDSLLFTGRLANISPVGDHRFEGIAYDPSQQGFTTLEERNSTSEAGQAQAGSIMNQTIYVPAPEWADAVGGTDYNARIVRASKLLRRILFDKMGLKEENVVIEIEPGGVTKSLRYGDITGGYETFLTIEEPLPTLGKMLGKIRKETKSEWWFDKEGVFHFGVPTPNRHILQFITDASAGKTTPPYQSIQLLASGSASEGGFSRWKMNSEEKTIIRRNLGKNENGATVPVEPEYSELNEPTFYYRNLEITTYAQAERVMESLAKDLAEQQSSGTVEVVGFPEINPLDAIVMPQARDSSKENYHENKPMGGAAYTVYKVVHRLNNSDGFKTIIHVGGLTDETGTVARDT